MSDQQQVSRLREHRLERGWSLVQVCVLTGISPADPSLVERGLRPCFPGWGRRLAEAYDVPVEELLDDAPDAA